MKHQDISNEADELWRLLSEEENWESRYSRNAFEKIDQERLEEEAAAIDLFQPWLHILETSIGWLSAVWAVLAERVYGEENKSKLLLSTWSLLSSSCNYAASVRVLVKSGLDNPARGVARALDEHLAACIAILHQPDLAEGFHSAQDHDTASQFWFKNFNTKRLKKHLNATEKSAGIPPDVSRELRDWRENELNAFSQTIHPNFVAGFMAANPQDARDLEKVGLGIFGKLSANSERTLNHSCKTIMYFSMVGGELLLNGQDSIPPLIEIDETNTSHQDILIGRKALLELNRRYWDYEIYPDSEMS